MSFPPRRILVPIDFSQHANDALGYAAGLAGADTQLIALHVGHPIPPIPEPLPAVTSAQAKAWHDLLEVRAQADRKELERHIAPWRDRFDLEEVHTVDQPANGIVATADEKQVDLIVMGSHGRSGFSRLLLGSVAERTVRLAHCPVLVVRHSEGSRAVWPPRHVLCPVDFSERSLEGLRYAAALARSCKARLLVLHALSHAPTPSVLPLGHELHSQVWAERSEELDRLAREELSRFIARVDAPPLTEQIVVTGDPATEVQRMVQEGHADFAVLTSHGRTGLGRALLGSVAERTVRQAGCPVLVVRPALADDEGA